MSRAIKAVACADLRQGVTEAEHAVLDLADERFDRWPDVPVRDLLAAAHLSVAIAVGGDPETGLGQQRVVHARDAAAILITALNRMDADGREVRS